MRPLKFASVYAGCGSLARGLVESGHELCFLVESDELCRDLLTGAFMHVETHRHADSLRKLPEETDLLAASFSTAGSAMAFGVRLAHIIRLAKNSHRVPWIFLELLPDALEARISQDSFGNHHSSPPDIAKAYEALEELGYSVAHRAVDLRGWGMPCMTARVLIVASKDGDPRQVLFTQRGTTMWRHVSSGGKACEAEALDSGGYCKTRCYSCSHPDANVASQLIGIDLVTGDWTLSLVPPLSVKNGGQVCFVGPQGSGLAQAVRLLPSYAEFLYGLPQDWTMLSSMKKRKAAEKRRLLKNKQELPSKAAATPADGKGKDAQPADQETDDEDDKSSKKRSKMNSDNKKRLCLVSSSMPAQFSAWVGERLLSLYTRPAEERRYVRNADLERPIRDPSVSWPMAGYSIGKERRAVSGMGEFPGPCKYIPIEKHVNMFHGDEAGEDGNVKGDARKWMKDTLPTRPDRQAFPEDIIESFRRKKKGTTEDERSAATSSQYPPLTSGEVGFVLYNDYPSGKFCAWPALLMDPELDDEKPYIPETIPNALPPNDEVGSIPDASDPLVDSFLQEVPTDKKAIMLLKGIDSPGGLISRWTHTGVSHFLPYYPLRAMVEMQRHRRGGTAIDKALHEADVRFQAEAGQRHKSSLPMCSILCRSNPLDTVIEAGAKLPLVNLGSFFSPCGQCLFCKHGPPEWAKSAGHPTITYPEAVSSSSNDNTVRGDNTSSPSSDSPFPATPVTWPECLMANVQAAAMLGNEGAKITITRESAIGTKVSVHWPLENTWYSGVLDQYHSLSTQYTVKYDDGDDEETWLWARDVRIIATGPMHSAGESSRSKWHKS